MLYEYELKINGNIENIIIFFYNNIAHIIHDGCISYINEFGSKTEIYDLLIKQILHIHKSVGVTEISMGVFNKEVIPKLKFLTDIPYELLSLVENQTDEICLAILKKDGNALRYIKNQTEEMCLTAVSHFKWALCLVREQTYTICYETATVHPRLVSHIVNHSVSIYTDLLSNNIIRPLDYKLMHSERDSKRLEIITGGLLK